MENKEKKELCKILKDNILKNKDKIEKKIKDDELIQFLLKEILLEEATTNEKILKYLDLKNIDFKGQNIIFIDFTETNANIDPQTVRFKALDYTKLIGDFKDKSFDGVCICGTDFRKTTNVKINPQKIYKKQIIDAKVDGVDFGNYSFEGVKTTNTSFEKAINCVIKEQNEFENYKQKIKKLFKDNSK